MKKEIELPTVTEISTGEMILKMQQRIGDLEAVAVAANKFVEMFAQARVHPVLTSAMFADDPADQALCDLEAALGKAGFDDANGHGIII